MHFFDKMSPTTKSKLLTTSAIFGIVAVFVLLAELSEKDQVKKKARPEKVRILVTQDPRSLGMDAVTARTLSLEKEQEKLIAENQKLQNTLLKLKEQTSVNNKLKNRIKKLEERDKYFSEELKKNNKEQQMLFSNIAKQPQKTDGKWKTAKSINSNPKFTASYSGKNFDSDTIKQPEMKHAVKRKPNSYSTLEKFSYGSSSSKLIDSTNKNSTSMSYEQKSYNDIDVRNSSLLMIIESKDAKDTKVKNDKNKEPEIYLPQGSILTGILITGMDAPTNASAQETPYPSLVRIKKEAILPNYQTLQETRECFALLGGYGDLSSERVMFRGEGISCVRKDGRVIETKFSAYAVGEDAKAGLRGRLVSRNSKVLVNAMLSGFASGLASVFGTNPVPVIATDLNAEQQYQNVFSRSAVQGGVAKGASNAMERLADYYMELADSTHPVIEISSGRIINIVVTKGTVMM